MRKRWILAITALVLLLAVTACGTPDATTGGEGPTATPEPSPRIIDYSVGKDLSAQQADALRQAWVEYTSGAGSQYELRGDLIYYGTRDDYMVFQAPITSGGIISGQFGYRRFESGGPMEIFLFYVGTENKPAFSVLSTALNFGYIEDVDWINRQHFLYCEQVLGYEYTYEMQLPPEEVRGDIHKECSDTVSAELPWNLTKGISYYGEYNGYHVVSVGERTTVKEKDKFGSFEFPDSDKYMFYLYEKDAEEIKLKSFMEKCPTAL